MMNYDKVVRETYPDITPDQYSLRDDGEGVYLDKWTYNAEMPDLSALANAAEQAEIEAQKQAQILKIKQTAYNQITVEYPLWRQLNIVSNRLVAPEQSSSEFDAMKTFIDGVRIASDEEEAALNE